MTIKNQNYLEIRADGRLFGSAKSVDTPQVTNKFWSGLMGSVSVFVNPLKVKDISWHPGEDFMEKGTSGRLREK